MEMTVLWSDSAISDLQAIYDYYITTANSKVANKMVNLIVERSEILVEKPRIGQIEELLKHKNFEIRYLVERQYKIVYLIEDQIVLISTVFDCRQNPKKLNKISI